MSALTVWYDGGCPMCRREIGWYRRLRAGEPVEWVDLDALGGADPAPDLPFARAMEAFHARCPERGLLEGVDAFIRLWAAFPLLRPLARVAAWAPVRAALAALYRPFARWRLRSRCADGACVPLSGNGPRGSSNAP